MQFVTTLQSLLNNKIKGPLILERGGGAKVFIGSNTNKEFLLRLPLNWGGGFDEVDYLNVGDWVGVDPNRYTET